MRVIDFLLHIIPMNHTLHSENVPHVSMIMDVFVVFVCRRPAKTKKHAKKDNVMVSVNFPIIDSFG